MIDDLKSFRADDPWQLISQEVAEYAIAGILFLAWLADRMGWLT